MKLSFANCVVLHKLLAGLYVFKNTSSDLKVCLVCSNPCVSIWELLA